MTAAAQGDGAPTVSVVIPVKDDSHELERCLRALQEQAQDIDEIIVVDNGSSDASAAVARVYGAIVVTCEEPGIPAASAHGYDCARGDLILRLDADCVPSPTWVETVRGAFEARPDVGLFTGGARFIDGPEALRDPVAFVYLAAYALVTTPALGHLPLFGSNLAMRREVWLSASAHVHRHDSDLHDDLDLAFHVGERHRIRYLPDASMGMSMRPFGDARSFATRVYRGFRTVLVHWPADFAPVRWVKIVIHRTLMPRLHARREGACA